MFVCLWASGTKCFLFLTVFLRLSAEQKQKQHPLHREGQSYTPSFIKESDSPGSGLLTCTVVHCTCRCRLDLFALPLETGAQGTGTKNVKTLATAIGRRIKFSVSNPEVSCLLPTFMKQWQADLSSLQTGYKVKSQTFHSSWQLCELIHARCVEQYLANGKFSKAISYCQKQKMLLQRCPRPQSQHLWLY